MKTLRFLSLFVFIIFFSACNEPEPLSPINVVQGDATLNKGKNTVSVMTRNIYVGTDVDMILQEGDPNQIPIRVAEAFQGLLATNFPERAEALAKEIAEYKPHLIGLQEVSLIRLQSPGDAVVRGKEPAEEVVMDYLEILMMTLNAMGLEYDVVAKVENSDVELPMIVNHDPMEFDDVRLTDYDVILAQREVEITNVDANNYQTKVPLSEDIELPRGYTAVTAKINGCKYRFVNTHLEDADQGEPLLQIQLAQAVELLSILALETIPIILVGDFNSAAVNGPSYQLVMETNIYKDAWLLNHSQKNPNGYTYGHDFDLLNSEQNFSKRIDYIFVRNGKLKYGQQRLKDVKAEVLGDEVADKTPSGLWPSDHGGVLAELRFFNDENYKYKK